MKQVGFVRRKYQFLKHRKGHEKQDVMFSNVKGCQCQLTPK